MVRWCYKSKNKNNTFLRLRFEVNEAWKIFNCKGNELSIEDNTLHMKISKKYRIIFFLFKN